MRIKLLNIKVDLCGIEHKSAVPKSILSLQPVSYIVHIKSEQPD